jgi:hypothetical protein
VASAVDVEFNKEKVPEQERLFRAETAAIILVSYLGALSIHMPVIARLTCSLSTSLVDLC